jgi:uncharacterized membrane protein
MIEPVLIVAIAVACTAWYMQHRWRKWRRNHLLAMPGATGLEVLARRYARGEIDRREYLQKRDDIIACQAFSQAQP